MKGIYFYVLLILISLVLACSNKKVTNSQTNGGKDSLDPIFNALPGEDKIGNPIDFDATKVLSKTYIIDRSGAMFWDKIDTTLSAIGTYPYGSQLDVIEVNGEWLGIRERVTRIFQREGGNVESSRWEKVYVRKEKTGYLSQIKLTEQDLMVAEGPLKLNRDEFKATGEPLSKYLSISLIDKNEFIKNRNELKDYLVKDSIYAKKKGYVMTIKASKKNVILKDDPVEVESTHSYEYLGHIPVLNQFLVGATYWENQGFIFIDMTTGEQNIEFQDFPYISNDQRKIVSIYMDPYAGCTTFDLYSNNDGTIKQLYRANFFNWFPAIETEQDIFWTDSHKIFIKVSHAAAFWTEDGNLNDQYQYIKIKIR